MYNLSGKAALVTGTSNKRGLGRGIALRLASEGADVVVSDKYKPLKDLTPWEREEGWRGLESLVTEIEALGHRGLAITADISKSQEVNNMVEKAVQEFGKIDILVNNASLIGRDIPNTPVVDMNEEVWHKTIAVNLSGVFLMCKAVAKQMMKQGQEGKIINISSLAGKRATAGRAHYSASKFGVIALTQSLALELAPHKINVNAVCPGGVATWGTSGPAIYEAIKQGLSEEEAIAKAYASVEHKIPLGRPAKVEEVANLVAFLASSQSDYMTGQAVNIGGGWLMAH